MVPEKNGKIEGVNPTPAKSPVQKKEEASKKFWHISRDMLRFKLHFFLFMGGLGSLVPYITIFAKNRVGISATSLASVLTTQQFLSIFSKPVIGYIADYFNKLKVIICVLTIVQTVFFFLLLTIPKIQEEEYETQNNTTQILNFYDYLNSSQLYLNCSSNRDDTLPLFDNIDNIDCFPSLDYLFKISNECSNKGSIARYTGQILIPDDTTNHSLFLKDKVNESSLISLHSHFESKCEVCCNSTKQCQSIKCEIPNVNQNNISPKRKIVSDFETYQFWAYAILTTVATACTNGLFTLSDTACCESVEKNGAQFGRQRLFGALGWGSIAPIGGLLNDYTCDFTAAWILMAVMSVASLLNILRLDLVKPQFSKDLLKDIGAVLRSKEFLAFNFCVFLNGICTGVLWYYLVWYLTVLGGSRFLCGMVNLVQCFVGEIPCMFFSGWIIKKIGQFNVVTLALMSYCIRFFWYSYLCNPWYVLPAEGLSGITYGLFYPAVAAYAKLSAKPGTEATTQAVLFAAHEGLGAGVGCVAAGVGFDNLGGQTTFFILSVFAGCSVVLSIILNLWFQRQKGSISVTSLQLSNT